MSAVADSLTKKLTMMPRAMAGLGLPLFRRTLYMEQLVSDERDYSDSTVVESLSKKPTMVSVL
ncbi:MAG: hypothetical protein A3D65_04200 [Candidatus Lloydbacteria bacterium RIFCSPHIGHO2_02_FULL_50_13]|uniref:Uncharacterized protein n=1 Tax=Candidatus Lloydbacteria bacterium RIFCSPHIGHO2_02_FULL_50_13 TaxID=1798661 RepID=A0A1G2DC46_9BACT|nr:MAG: hypothetical protein A3D65_04200 [Candidatus Lloydbacteria bacterium RIFCSPHIGHO2_02_FULL_50_13]